jgi:hydrogenase small subunit
VARADGEVLAALLARGISRRSFMKFCAAMTATLALPATYTPRIASAVATAPRLPLVWIRGQGCGGDGEALLRAANPTIAELLLQFLSIDYLETLMIPSGADAMAALAAVQARQRDVYLLVVEGSVPTADRGAWWTVGGRPVRDVIREASAGAAGTIAVGSCAFDGGLSAAAGGASGAVAVGQVAQGRLVALPGCPVNPWNLAATIVHFLTFKELPATDAGGRPLFAYGPLIHNECERRAHFEFGEFVQAWGDEGAQKGWCLYRMGCKGPQTFANCASVGFDGGTSWPIKAGFPCIGCTMPAFWDSMSPFSRRLPSPIPFFPDVTVDQLGQAAVAGIAGVAGLHAVGSYVRAKRQGARERRLAPAAAAVAAEPAAVVEPSRIAEPGAVAEAAETVAAPAQAPASPEAEVAAAPTTVEAPTGDEAPADEAPAADEVPAAVEAPDDGGAGA